MTDGANNAMPANLGRYEIVRELGRGAMGVVYEGFDPAIQRRVAIKTARRELLAKANQAEETMTRFLREARAAGALNHPNIITIYDTGEENGTAYIAMEFIEGGTLHDRMATGQPWEPSDVVELGATLAKAIAFAHEHGVIHRDIKPANIMLPERGPIKIADFGIAHVSDSSLTQQGDIIGTPYYMSPEQFMGAKVEDTSDLFSLGVILYEMLTGEKPFRGESLNAIMHEALKRAPVAPHELNYTVSETLSQVILKALEKVPGNRYQSGNTFAAALRECLNPTPDPAVTLASAAVAKSDRHSDESHGSGDPGEVSATVHAAPPTGPPADHRPTTRSLRPARSTLYVTGAALASLLVVALVARNWLPAEESSPCYATVSVYVWPIPDQDCFTAWESADAVAQTQLPCIGEANAQVTACNGDASDDCLPPVTTSDVATFDLVAAGKQWKTVRLEATQDGYTSAPETLESARTDQVSASRDMFLFADRIVRSQLGESP